MAVTPCSSSSKLNRSVPAKQGKIKSPVTEKEKEKNCQKKKSENGLSSPAKRNNDPGIRLIHGRIYDSQNGKTCHQCRQKTRDFSATCKNLRNNKPCPISFCHKCLLNRYGEKAEEVCALQEWLCPKCKGICNCSFCMKKRGQQPTGILIRAAKANGFSSVSEMLKINGPDNCHMEKSNGGLSRKRAAPEIAAVSNSPRKKGKENTFDGKINPNLCALPLPSNLADKKSKKVKVEVSKELHNDSGNDPVHANVLPRKSKKLRAGQKERSRNKDCDSGLKETGPLGGERKQEKIEIEGSNEKLDSNIIKTDLMKDPIMNSDVQKLKTQEQDELKEVHDGDKNGVAFVRRTSPRKCQISNGTSNINAKSKIDVDPKERKLPKAKVSVEGSVAIRKDKEKQEVHDGDKNGDAFVRRTSPRKHPISNGTSKSDAKSKIDVDPHGRKLSKAKVHVEGLGEPLRKDEEKQKADISKSERPADSDNGKNNSENETQACTGLEDINKHIWRSENNDINPEIALPLGFELTSLHDIEVPPEDVGKALQFLEFFAVFGEILGVKKKQPEFVLRDLIFGRRSRRGKYSATIQFLIQLLSVIQEERGQGSSALSQTGRNSWIHALNECISESGSVSKSLDLDSLDKRADEFENLDCSKKLTILNFLCDEILGTEKMRDWIDDQVSQFAEKAKKHKDRVLAAKEKEKSLVQQIKNEIAKLTIQSNGVGLSISENDAVIRQIKCKAAEAHAELLESKGLLLKNNQSSDAVRTEPIYLGIDGRAYWRLKCLSNSSYILLQDVGTGDTCATDEKWSAFEDEQKEVIEKHINSLRVKRLRAQRFPLQQRPQNNEDCQEAIE